MAYLSLIYCASRTDDRGWSTVPPSCQTLFPLACHSTRARSSMRALLLLVLGGHIQCRLMFHNSIHPTQQARSTVSITGYLARVHVHSRCHCRRLPYRNVDRLHNQAAVSPFAHANTLGTFPHLHLICLADIREALGFLAFQRPQFLTPSSVMRNPQLF